MARTKQTSRERWHTHSHGVTRNALSRRQRALLDAFERHARCALVQPATMLCGRVYWLEGVGTNCQRCGGRGAEGCGRCGYEPRRCAVCGDNAALVRDPQTGAVLCERDVLRAMAMHTLVVCQRYGLHEESLKRAVLQAVFGPVPLQRMSARDADEDMGVNDVSDDDGSEAGAPDTSCAGCS